jgi:5-methylcytosine-specific restriction enzyme A
MPWQPPIYRPAGWQPPKARKKAADAARPDRAVRGRHATNRRGMWLDMHPLCAECERQGRVRAAVEIDHIVALADGGPDLDADGIEGLCLPCHRKKSAEERRRRGAAGAPAGPTR